MYYIIISYHTGGYAVSGLIATSPVGVENVMCPDNVTSAANCSFVSPPQSLQCAGFSNAAGVRCVQGLKYKIIADIIFENFGPFCSERMQCFTEGEYSFVNVTFDPNYLAFLGGREFAVSGKVVVCQGGIYSSVCDVDWDQADANVLCNSPFIGVQTSFSKPACNIL